MGTVSKVDKDGFINLNIKVHRDDIYEMTEKWGKETPKVSKEKFRLICEKMHNWMSGGDDYYGYLKAAYKEVMGKKEEEDVSEPGHPDNPRSTYNTR